MLINLPLILEAILILVVPLVLLMVAAMTLGQDSRPGLSDGRIDRVTRDLP